MQRCVPPQRSGAHVIVAGRDQRAVHTLADEVGGTPVLLDLSSLASVEAALRTLGRVDVAVSNAAIQSLKPRKTTQDGFEATFQVNHLAPFALLDGLLARTSPPTRVITVGSSTHDGSSRTGMPSPIIGDLAVMANGGPDDDQAGRRRYATSKLLTTATATAFGLARTPKCAPRASTPAPCSTPASTAPTRPGSRPSAGGSAGSPARSPASAPRRHPAPHSPP